MPVLQELSSGQIDEIIQAASDKQVPAILTISARDSWANLHSRILCIDGQHLLLERPGGQDNAAPHEFVPAERIGVSFKLKHHKHVFTSVLAVQQMYELPDGTEIPALAVVLPVRMQKLQRRAFLRADVPPNRIVRGSFWLGGCNSEPSGTSEAQPVWSGRVTNISAGGFQLMVDAPVADGLEAGDTVGVRLIFGTSGEAIYADAQFRHAEINTDKAMLGFQFVGLTETPEGRVALQVLTTKVAEYDRMNNRNGSGGRN